MHRYADKYGLRVASMPGFSDLMIPALEIDYNDVAKKVDRLHSFFSRSEFADIVFSVGKKDYTLHIDFRKRTPLKDDGNCREKGTVINLPSGEAFTSPYDEIDSETNGYFPIEQAGEVVVYKVKKNRITGANKDTALLKKIRQEAAVGNIAEMAFGVLSLYGIKPCGRVLLDEKLGMHIALGRDDHFGGSTGPDSFREKENIWHQDYVYIKEMQPHIAVKEAKLGDSIIIKDSRYIIF
jgi:leucyl aminopeptidase (aminopeptidase T)